MNLKGVIEKGIDEILKILKGTQIGKKELSKLEEFLKQ